jgi:hypothetical protein
MPQDAICPGCTHSFPVTEARGPFAVSCPQCEIELTVEFKRPAVAPEPGQPPYELSVLSGGLPAPAVSGPKKQIRKDDDDDEDRERKGASTGIAFLTGGLGLLFVFLSLVLTGWILFTQIDTETTWDKASTYTFSQTPGGGWSQTDDGPNPGGIRFPDGIIPPPPEPTKPKDTFDLKPAPGTLSTIVPLTDLEPMSPKTVLLPGRANGVSVGGGGRYIVFHFPQQGRLAVFDVNSGDLLPDAATLPNGDAALTAGANKLVVSVPNSKKLRVFSLPDLKQQKEFENPLFFGTKVIAMGSRTNGPLLVSDPFGHVLLMDIDSGKVIDGSERELQLPSNHIRATPDGKLFLAGNGYGANDKFRTVDEAQQKWRVLEPDIFAAYPGPDGRRVYGRDLIVELSGNRVTPLARKPAGVTGNVWYAPALTRKGDYFLRVNETKVGAPPRQQTVVSVAIHKGRNVDTPVLPAWEGLPESEGLISWGNSTEPLDRRLFLIPEAQLLVILNRDKTQLIVRKVPI